MNYLSRIGFLMAGSQVLLLLFTAHWIYSQYGDEKRILEDDLQMQLSNAKMQVMDSMLVVHLINPILQDKKGFKLHVAVSDDDELVSSDGKEKKINRSVSFTKLPDSLLESRLNNSKQWTQNSRSLKNDSASDLLVKGVRLIYDEVKTLNDDGYDELNIIGSTDTNLLKRIFSENLQKKGLNMPVNWVSRDSAFTTKEDGKTLFLESRIFPHSFGAELGGYRLFLIRKIIPQISFSLILLALTSSAFIISFRSLRNQMRLSALKNDFISNISHELKTPVSTVKVAIEALQDPARTNKSEIISDYLDMASQEIHRLELLINKVLDTSGLESNKNFIKSELIELDKLTDELLQSFQIRMRDTNAQLHFEKGNGPFPVLIDKLHTEGVLINLIDNSLKYGGKNVSIDLKIYRIDDEVILEFGDNGPGIPEEYKDKIFDKFFRIPNDNIHNVKGSGLGLSYSWLVMNHQRGSIKVRNKKEGGCLFTLNFPAA